jgi:hypothetical protein
MCFDVEGEVEAPVRFEVRDYRTVTFAPTWHDGECLVDDDYDGQACCPLGDIEET